MNYHEDYMKRLDDYHRGAENAKHSIEQLKRIERSKFAKVEKDVREAVEWAENAQAVVTNAGVRVDLHNVDEYNRVMGRPPTAEVRDPQWVKTYPGKANEFFRLCRLIEDLQKKQVENRTTSEQVKAVRKDMVADRLNLIVLFVSVISFIGLFTVGSLSRIGTDFMELTLFLFIWAGAWATWTALRPGFLFGAMTAVGDAPPPYGKGVGQAVLAQTGLIMVGMGVSALVFGNGELNGFLLGVGALIGLGLLFMPAINLLGAARIRRQFNEHANYYFPRKNDEPAGEYDDQLYNKLAGGADKLKKKVGPKNKPAREA